MCYPAKSDHVGIYSRSVTERQRCPTHSARHRASRGNAPHCRAHPTFHLNGHSGRARATHASESYFGRPAPVPSWLSNLLCGALFGGWARVGASDRAGDCSHRRDATRDAACAYGAALLRRPALRARRRFGRYRVRHLAGGRLFQIARQIQHNWFGRLSEIARQFFEAEKFCARDLADPEYWLQVSTSTSARVVYGHSSVASTFLTLTCTVT
jgi:hypothetical protein